MTNASDTVHGIDPRPVPRILDVEPVGETALAVRWDFGRTDLVDLAGWIAVHDVAELRAPSTFLTAAVVDHGTAVQWGGDESLSIDSIHLEMLAEQQAPFEAAQFAAWQERLHLSNNEAADLLDVSLSTLHTYKNGTGRIPQSVRIACRAVERDPVILAAHHKPRRGAGRPPKATSASL